MTDFASAAIGISLPVLAQIASGFDNRSAAVWWLVGLAAVAFAFNQIVVAWRSMTQRFAERDGSGPRYQTAARCDELHRKIEAGMATVDERHSHRTDALRREIKADVEGVHSRINDVLRAVSTLGGKIDGWRRE